MKKPSESATQRPLVLRRESLRDLTADELRKVVGGGARRTARCA